MISEIVFWMSIILTRLFQISKKICIPKISISDIRNKNFAIIIIIIVTFMSEVKSEYRNL